MGVMNVRPPKSLARTEQHDSPMLAALEHELLMERGETLVRVAKRFEALLAKLNGMSAEDPARPPLARDTARALWMLTVQREVMGLSGGEALVNAYDIPGDVRAASGIVTRKVTKGQRGSARR